jgi:hypothetical protein
MMSRFKTKAKKKQAVKRTQDTRLEAKSALAGYGSYGICLMISCEVRRVLYFCDLQAKSRMGWYRPKSRMGWYGPKGYMGWYGPKGYMG